MGFAARKNFLSQIIKKILFYDFLLFRTIKIFFKGAIFLSLFLSLNYILIRRRRFSRMFNKSFLNY